MLVSVFVIPFIRVSSVLQTLIFHTPWADFHAALSRSIHSGEGDKEPRKPGIAEWFLDSSLPGFLISFWLRLRAAPCGSVHDPWLKN